MSDALSFYATLRARLGRRKEIGMKTFYKLLLIFTLLLSVFSLAACDGLLAVDGDEYMTREEVEELLEGIEKNVNINGGDDFDITIITIFHIYPSYQSSLVSKLDHLVIKFDALCSNQYLGNIFVVYLELLLLQSKANFVMKQIVILL